MVISSMPAVSAEFGCHFENPYCLSRLEQWVFSLMTEMARDFQKDLVYLCVGTDRATGDCLGPLVGTHLQGFASKINLFGTLETPAHAVNLPDIIEEIHSRFADPLIIAVDASLGSPARIGYINVRPRSLNPGTALHKSLPPVGDFHISAVVNAGGYSERTVLQNTRLYIVYKMSALIARSLYLAHLRYENERRFLLISPDASRPQFRF